MNNKILSIKTTSAIFLATLLVLGTISTLLPSVQAQPYYEMDDGYGSYEPEPRDNPPQYAEREYNSYPSEYEIDNYKKSYRNNNYEQPREYSSYQQDYKEEYPKYVRDSDGYKSKKDTSNSVSINKLNCINNNVNINGNNTGDINVGNSGSSATGSGADEGYLGIGSFSGYGEGYDNGYNKQKGESFTCLINNNNINNNFGVGNATDGNEILKCEECFNENTTLAIIITNLLAAPGFIEVIPNIVIGEEVVTIAQLCDFLEREIAEGDIFQTTAGLTEVIAAILNNGPHPFVSQASITALVNCLLGVDFPNTNGPLTPFDINIGATNTDISAFDINTVGGLTASSFSSPPTIAQGTEDLSAMEKTTKLKQQWLNLLP